MAWITDPQTGNRIWKEDQDISGVAPASGDKGWQKYIQTEGGVQRSTAKRGSGSSGYVGQASRTDLKAKEEARLNTLRSLASKGRMFEQRFSKLAPTESFQTSEEFEVEKPEYLTGEKFIEKAESSTPSDAISSYYTQAKESETGQAETEMQNIEKKNITAALESMGITNPEIDTLEEFKELTGKSPSELGQFGELQSGVASIRMPGISAGTTGARRLAALQSIARAQQTGEMATSEEAKAKEAKAIEELGTFGTRQEVGTQSLKDLLEQQLSSVFGTSGTATAEEALTKQRAGEYGAAKSQAAQEEELYKQSYQRYLENLGLQQAKESELAGQQAKVSELTPTADYWTKKVSGEKTQAQLDIENRAKNINKELGNEIASRYSDLDTSFRQKLADQGITGVSLADIGVTQDSLRAGDVSISKLMGRSWSEYDPYNIQGQLEEWAKQQDEAARMASQEFKDAIDRGESTGAYERDADATGGERARIVSDVGPKSLKDLEEFNRKYELQKQLGYNLTQEEYNSLSDTQKRDLLTKLKDFATTSQNKRYAAAKAADLLAPQLTQLTSKVFDPSNVYGANLSDLIGNIGMYKAASVGGTGGTGNLASKLLEARTAKEWTPAQEALASAKSKIASLAGVPGTDLSESDINKLGLINYYKKLKEQELAKAQKSESNKAKLRSLMEKIASGSTTGYTSGSAI